MNSTETLNVLDMIAADSSKNGKLDLVKKYSTDETFRKVLGLAYNPFNIYGILPTKDDEAIPSGLVQFEEAGTFEFLDKLIKRELTGNAARDALVGQLANLDTESGRLLIRILRKDLRAGFGDSTINKAIKDYIPVFPYMRCSLPKDAKIDQWNWAGGIISQEKADGMFANGNLIDDVLSFVSRQGSPFPMTEFKELTDEAVKNLRNMFQYHGELLVERDGVILAREVGNGILNSVLKGGSFEPNEKPVYAIWDLIPLSEVKSKGQYKLAYADRLEALKEMTKDSEHIRVIPSRIVYSMKEAYEHFLELTAVGKEGTIIKKPSMIWKDGTSKEQVKLKVEAPCELEVVSINKGKVGGKNENLPGSLHCKSSCGLLEVDVNVKNDKMRKHVHENQDEWIGSIVTVIFNQILKPGENNDKYSLFLPRLAEDVYRIDKTEADDLVRIQEQYDNIITGKTLV